MAMIIADSDVLIDFLRGNKPTSERVALELGAGRLNTTVISAFELLAGAKTAKQILAVNTLRQAVSIQPLSLAAARLAGKTHLDLQLRGQEIGMADSLIAGICLDLKAALFTRNQKHFSRVPSLKLSSYRDE